MSEQPNPAPGQSLVVRSEAGHYSLWQASAVLPAGWSGVGITGTREECLAWIEAHWADMRPHSLLAKSAPGRPRS
jgi:MbtH protein